MTAAELIASTDDTDGQLWIVLAREDGEGLDTEAADAWEAADYPDSMLGWHTYLATSSGEAIVNGAPYPGVVDAGIGPVSPAEAQTLALAYWGRVGISPIWTPRDSHDEPLAYDTFRDHPDSESEGVPSGQWVRVLWHGSRQP